MFEAFLKDLMARRGGRLDLNEPIIKIWSARTALETTCRQLGQPQYSHHTMRHFSCSEAIEAGVDFKVIAEWLGHKDGGVLVAKTYGHQRNEHSATIAKHMTFGVVDQLPANVIPFPPVSNK
jgi:integrase